MSYFDRIRRNNTQHWAIDPRRYFDLGLTEGYQKMFHPNTAQASTGGSDLNPLTGGTVPVAPNDVRNISGVEREWSTTNDAGNTVTTGYGQQGLDSAKASSAPQPQIQGDDRYDRNANPGDGYFWDAADGWKSSGGGGGNDGGLGAQIALARSAYDQNLRGLQNAFGEARGIYDEGIGSINRKREEFEDAFNQGNADIQSRFDQERGNLQRSSVENKNRLRNILRATGMGGSALVRGIGSQDKANLRNLGNLSEERTFNERENLKGFNAQKEWARGQESALGRFLEAAQNRLQEGIGRAGLVQQGDIGGINSAFDNLRSQIFAQNAALQAARGDISGYQVNPYAVNMSDMTNSLNAALPSFGNTGVNANQAVSLAPENMSYLDRLRQRAGGSLYA